MKQIAWFPQGMLAAPELIAVRVTPGRLTRRDWEEALAARVVEMVLREPNPTQAAERATKMLELPAVTNPQQAGEALVKYNLALQTALSCAMIDSDPFPALARLETAEARQALETDLETWLESAASMVSASSLD